VTLSAVPPPGPTPAEAAALAAKLGTYALDVCVMVIPGHSAVMLFRDAVAILTDGEEDLHACRPPASSPSPGWGPAQGD